jgi:hypothetical protein
MSIWKARERLVVVFCELKICIAILFNAEHTVHGIRYMGRLLLLARDASIFAVQFGETERLSVTPAISIKQIWEKGATH